MVILIVEDEQRAREGLVKLLNSIPGEHKVVAQASNGQAALELLTELKPDVVFTDIKMPFVDGITLARTARGLNLPTEFVMISAYGDFELARQAISLDVVEYMLKPVTRDDLERTLLRVKDRLSGKRGYTRMKTENLRDKYPDAHPIILRTLDVIQAGYAGKINQKNLAGSLGVSPEYFSYLFSKNIGQTFSVFLRNYRIEKAMELYRSEGCSKQDVPYMVGFSDAKYFAQVFRTVVGKSPAEYLRQGE